MQTSRPRRFRFRASERCLSERRSVGILQVSPRSPLANRPIAATAEPRGYFVRTRVGRSMMFRWAMLGLICAGSASGGFISFRLGQKAASRDLASGLSAHVTADAQAPARRRGEKAMESVPRPLRSDDLTAAREELRLIEEANAAVNRGDFASALSPLMEHERRFQRGWLSRERENLSVKAVDGLLLGQPAPSSAPPSQPPGAFRAHHDLNAAARSPTPDVPSATASRP